MDRIGAILAKVRGCQMSEAASVALIFVHDEGLLTHSKSGKRVEFKLRVGF